MRKGDMVKVFNGIKAINLSYPVSHGILVEKHKSIIDTWYVCDSSGQIITCQSESLEIISEHR